MEAAIKVLPIVRRLALRTMKRTILINLAQIGWTERLIEQVLVAQLLWVMVCVHRVTIRIPLVLRVRLIRLIDATRDICPHALVLMGIRVRRFVICAATRWYGGVRGR